MVGVAGVAGCSCRATPLWSDSPCLDFKFGDAGTFGTSRPESGEVGRFANHEDPHGGTKAKILSSPCGVRRNSMVMANALCRRTQRSRGFCEKGKEVLGSLCWVRRKKTIPTTATGNSR